MSEETESIVAKMPPDILERAIKHLQSTLSEESINDIRALYDMDPEGWWKHFHNTWGREIRDSLRIRAGLYDSLLPDGGWEVYYVPCVEIVIGRLEMPDEQGTQAE